MRAGLNKMESRYYQSEGKRSVGRSRWGPALLFGGVAALYFVTTRPSPVSEGWGTDYRAARAEAARTAGSKSDGRKVLIAFYMDGCPPCAAMDRLVLSTAAVRSALDAFVPVRVDVDKERELANQFEVLGTPTYAVVDADGGILAKCEGYQPVAAFMKFLAGSATLGERDIAAEAAHPPGGP